MRFSIVGAALCLAAAGSAQTFSQKWTNLNPFAAGVTEDVRHVALSKNGNYLTLARGTDALSRLSLHTRAGYRLRLVTLPVGPGESNVVPVKLLVNQSSGTIYAVGMADTMSLGKEVYLAAYDMNLNLLWQHTIGRGALQNDNVVDAILDSSGNICTVGYSSTVSGAHNFEAAFFISDPNGALLYTGVYAPIVDDIKGMGIARDPGGDILFCGTFYVSGGFHGFVRRFNMLTSTFTLEYEDPSPGSLRTITQDNAGRIYVGGDSSGNSVVHRFIGTNSTPDTYTGSPGTVTQLIASNGGVYGGGTEAGDAGLLAAKFGAGAFPTPLWARNYRYFPTGYNKFESMTVDSSGELYIAGSSATVAGFLNARMVVSKFSAANGALRFALNWKPVPNEACYPIGIALHDGSGDFMLARASQTTGDNLFLAGYIQSPIANPDLFRGAKDTVLNSNTTLISNDRYTQGTTISISAAPSHGSVVINANKTITYTPDPGFVGNDTFRYQLSKAGVNSSLATVTLVIR